MTMQVLPWLRRSRLCWIFCSVTLARAEVASSRIRIFGFFRKTKNQPVPVLDTIAAELDKCSFGIYLLHMAVLRYIFLYMKFNPFEHGGTLTIIGIAAFTMILSYTVTKLLKFVPYVNKLI